VKAGGNKPQQGKAYFLKFWLQNIIVIHLLCSSTKTEQ